MSKPIPGIHHVTMIAGSPQTNLDFYTKLLGMRLVKLTVNFDDPGSYHFYYGDGLGRPGTLLTFFPHPGGYQGRVGAGQTSAVALAVPAGSLDYWIDRFAAEAVDFDGPHERFEEQYISLKDPDGLTIEIFESGSSEGETWSNSPVPGEHAIRSVHSVTLLQKQVGATGNLLSEMGFTETSGEENRTRFEGDPHAFGRYVDLIEEPQSAAGRVAVGSVHHVAFRTESDLSQREWREKLSAEQYGVSPVMERDYFKSIYFREPGGVLFEIATDGPGMSIDESPEGLGSHLKLPEWLEPQREKIEKALPPLRLPSSLTEAK
jgi:glyoxalase family protein